MITDTKTNVSYKRGVCENCGEVDVIDRCSGCQRVFYCNTKCQASHWKKHIEQCLLHRVYNEKFDTCSICIQQIYNVSAKTLTNCNHTYHTYCINKWLIKNHTCPMCRNDL
jgi:hypothetical protein